MRHDQGGPTFVKMVIINLIGTNNWVYREREVHFSQSFGHFTIRREREQIRVAIKMSNTIVLNHLGVRVSRRTLDQRSRNWLFFLSISFDISGNFQRTFPPEISGKSKKAKNFDVESGASKAQD